MQQWKTKEERCPGHDKFMKDHHEEFEKKKKFVLLNYKQRIEKSDDYSTDFSSRYFWAMRF